MFKSENAGYHNAQQSCYICHQTHDGVDAEVFIEGEGLLWLCRNCCGELARCAGFLVNADHSEEIARLQHALELAIEQREASDAELLAVANYAKSARARREAKEAEKAEERSREIQEERVGG